MTSAWIDDSAIAADGPNADSITFRGHKTDVVGLAFSSDGRQIASVSNVEIRLYDSTTAALILAFPLEEGAAVEFQPDGKRIAAATRRHITFFNATDGSRASIISAIDPVFGNYPFPPSITSMRISADGKQLASASGRAQVGGPHGLPGGMVRVWSTETGREATKFANLSTVALCATFSPNGQLLATGTDGAGGELPEPGELQIFKIATGDRMHCLKIKPKINWDDIRYSIHDVAFSPDGTRIAAAVSDSVVHVWDVQTGQETLALRGHRRRVLSVMFHPSGKQLASAGDDGTIRLWDTESGQSIRILTGHSRRIPLIRYSPDGKRLASTSVAPTQLSPAVAGLIDPDIPRVTDSPGKADADQTGEFRIWNLAPPE